MCHGSGERERIERRLAQKQARCISRKHGMVRAYDGFYRSSRGMSPMDLLQYEHLKFDLASVLRAASARLQESSPRHETDVRDLFARLAEDRFNLVVVGRFSRGKSTLMNAIFGMIGYRRAFFHSPR